MNYRYAVAGAGLVVVLAGGIFMMKKHPSAVRHSPADLSKTQGPADAPVQIIEYSDFQCPACKRGQESLRKLFEAHPGKIHIVFRHYPLPGHQWAGIAHQAAECAALKGSFWPYHDRLYGNQEVWSKSPNPAPFLLQYAGETGINLEPFANCLMDSSVVDRILADKKAGDGLQVMSTPTFFINGERLVGPIDLENKGEGVVRRILGEPPLPPAPAPPAPVPAAAPVSTPAPDLQ